jgi:hydrogenase maturation protein HypF
VSHLVVWGYTLTACWNIRIQGQVQGVGFRPFVYNLANELSLVGWVRNNLAEVEIVAQGEEDALQGFAQALRDKAPPLAEVDTVVVQPVALQDLQTFAIVASQATGGDIRISPDQAPCADCLIELFDEHNRRYQYPFINCTQCGPRYSIIQSMPYDRENTSMAAFVLCPVCQSEYDTPLDRRFHAEPNACPVCGPVLRFNEECEGPDALNAAVLALVAGKIVAVKGASGFHFLCDATNDTAVMHLRKRKHRPSKPFALMVADVAMAESLVVGVDDAWLDNPVKPIILAGKRVGAQVSEHIAPGLCDLGVMLPSTPLYALLCRALARPMVATSANISGEPVLTDDTEAKARLGDVADVWLTHNRKIVRPADDTVLRVVGDTCSAIRLGRGVAPWQGRLPKAIDRPTLALGGQQKNTLCLAWGDTVVISPHIGDLANMRSIAVFEQLVADLPRLYQQPVQQLVCDAHPDYASSRFARHQGMPVATVQHHYAHASALAGEHGLCDKIGLVFCWDGAGFSEDGSIWGGEVLLGQPGAWQRVGCMCPYRVTGGDRVAREPWRSAAGLYWQAGLSFDEHPDAGLVYQAYQRGMQTVTTTSVGRLFDAAAWMLGLAEDVSFEGEAAMRLESCAHMIEEAGVLPLMEDAGVVLMDWLVLLEMLGDSTRTVSERASRFHAVLVNTVIAMVRYFKDPRQVDVTINYVGLSGGVFQNRVLTELILQQIDVRVARTIPANDGGLSYGQMIEYLYAK